MPSWWPALPPAAGARLQANNELAGPQPPSQAQANRAEWTPTAGLSALEGEDIRAQAGAWDKGVKQMKVLVAYASKYGSTRGIAERIAEQLRATEFARRHRAVLADRPVWLFSSGPIGTTATKYDPVEPIGMAELKRAVSPLGHRVFAGAWDRAKLDRGKLGLAEQMIAKVLPQGDFRDWAAIEEWALSIARALPVQPTASP